MKISVSLPDELAARVDGLRRADAGRSKVIQELLEEALLARGEKKTLGIPGVKTGRQLESEYVSDEEGL